MVKAKGLTQEDIDRRETERRAKREVGEARVVADRRYVVAFRLILWLMRYVWPRLTAEERAEIREIIPDEMETEIRNALEKLP